MHFSYLDTLGFWFLRIVKFESDLMAGHKSKCWHDEERMKTFGVFSVFSVVIYFEAWDISRAKFHWSQLISIIRLLCLKTEICVKIFCQVSNNTILKTIPKARRRHTLVYYFCAWRKTNLLMQGQIPRAAIVSSSCASECVLYLGKQDLSCTKLNGTVFRYTVVDFFP